MRRVVVLAESPDHVCYRYRYAAFRDRLRAHGWLLEPLVLEKSWPGRLRQFATLRFADAVVLQRKLLPVCQLSVLRRFASVLFFDFDDAVLYRDSYASKGTPSWNRRRLFAATLRSVDRVIAGNWFLAHLATSWCPSHRVQRIPTCVNLSRYAGAEHTNTEKVELGWIGSRSTAQAFELARPLFEGIGKGVPGVRLRVIADDFPSFTHLPVISHLWSEQGEAAALAGCDIGVSWLPDDPWSRGKCGLKVLQYMAAGLPVIANSVGPHRELIEHEKTGFLVETLDEWRTAITILAANPALRHHMGTAARRRVAEHYSLTRWAGPLASCLDRAVAKPPEENKRYGELPKHHFRTIPSRTLDARETAGPIQDRIS